MERVATSTFALCSSSMMSTLSEGLIGLKCVAVLRRTGPSLEQNSQDVGCCHRQWHFENQRKTTLANKNQYRQGPPAPRGA